MVRRSREHIHLSSEERIAQIVRVATDIMAERGYWGMSLQDVASECGITVAGVIHHVKNKTGLLMKVFEYIEQDQIKQVNTEIVRVTGRNEGDLKSGESPSQEIENLTLNQACNILVSYNAKNPLKVKMYSILEAEALDEGHPAYAALKEREQVTLDLFAKLAAKSVGEENPHAAARLVLSMMDGLQLQWLREPENVDFVEEWHKLTSMVSLFNEE